jgi:hypothetical protein
VVSAAVARRALLIATPFVLLGIGFWRLMVSPWPAIWRLALKGQHVWVRPGWATYGELGLVIACFAAALAISFSIRRRDPGAIARR